MLYKKDLIPVKKFLQEVEEIKSKLSKDKHKEVVNLIAFMFNELSVFTKDEIKDTENWNVISEFEIDDYFSSYLGDNVKVGNLFFMLELAKYVISKKNDINLLNKILDVVLSMSESFSYVNRVFDRFTWIKDESISKKLEVYISKNKSRLSEPDLLYCMHIIEKSKSNYSEALGFFKKYKKLIDIENDESITLIYLHLLSRDYDGVLDFIADNKSKIERFSTSEKGIVIINELTAKKLKYNKLDISDKKELENVIAKHSENKRILICANSLLDKNPEALHHIKELISANFTFFHEIKEWPAINESLKDDATRFFNSLLSSNPKIHVA